MAVKKYRDAYASNGMCANCGKRPAREFYTTCEVCAERNRAWYQKHRKKGKKGKKEEKKPAMCTICCYCDNMQCSWRLGFVPVAGWVAEPLGEQDVMVGIEEVQTIDGKVRGIKKRIHITTYNVRRCPEFQRKAKYANDDEFRGLLKRVYGAVQTGMAWITCKRGNGRKKRNERLY